MVSNTPLCKTVPITPIKVGNCELNSLRVEIDYDKGGLTFSGDAIPRGIICRVKPIGIHKGIVSEIALGKQHHVGFRVFLEDCGRRSPKKMKMYAEKILPHTEEIAGMYMNGKFNDAYLVISKVANNEV
jgi:hypothetical protein